MKLSLDYICQAVSGEILKGDKKTSINGITTDSRQISPGALFFALKGEQYDGHNFVLEALEKGASAAVISESIDISRIRPEQVVIKVNDTLQALQDLAQSYRQQFNLPVIAVTGSVGKTTTKDIIASCLQSRFNTLKTEGNLNNDIGVPLTIFQLERNYQAAVLELAMRARGEIKRLAKISRPTGAVITNIEPVHLETMQTIENIALSKCEVLSELDKDNFALINGDDELLVNTAQNYSCKLFTFGRKKTCDFQIKKVTVENKGIEVDIRLIDKEDRFYFPVPSVKLAYNVAGGIAAAYLLGINIEETKTRLAKFIPSGNRLNIIYLPEGGIIINDTYNANPISMTAALETSKAIRKTGKLIAVLGDMFEMGDYEISGHMEVGRKVYETGVDILVAVGERAEHIAKGAIEAGMPSEQVYHFASKPEGLELLLKIHSTRDTILFKASRGMEFETLVSDMFKPVG
jgi:UDP-N-acetylmuramoyl-tripeptide--D-alanyl-D-alanine ligase